MTRGRGLALGIDLGASGGPLRADRPQHHAFEQGLIVELCGRDNEVVKLPPPLPVDLALLDRGLDVLLQGLRTIRRT
ncbi:hypothetical protein [Streptomyces achromogenes]|uniref:hypothetical protein n=1 Tax=Streptomyces achromogenes TaxID=67255 RepID=UPI0034460810